MLEKEFQFYLDNQKELVEKYSGKFIVIKNNSIIGVYNSHSDAYNNSLKENELGTFLIQHCIEGEQSYTQTFHSQVIIHSIGR